MSVGSGVNQQTAPFPSNFRSTDIRNLGDTDTIEYPRDINWKIAFSDKTTDLRCLANIDRFAEVERSYSRKDCDKEKELNKFNRR